jgi:hypothetical protein
MALVRRAARRAGDEAAREEAASWARIILDMIAHYEAEEPDIDTAVTLAMLQAG